MKFLFTITCYLLQFLTCSIFIYFIVTCSLYLDEPRLLQNGESISPEVCTNCTCMNGELICETIECPSLECGELEVKAYIPGKCCPVCSPRLVIDPIEPEPECTEPEGRLFRDPEDPCMTCRCSRGRKSCVSELCPSSDCANPVLVPGVCCPVCPEITPEPVETTESPRGPIIDPFVTPAPECNRRGFFRDPTDPCKTCRCVNGAAECYDDSERFCGPTPCENPVRIPGNCCPVCPLPDLETTIEQVTMNTDTTNTPQTNFEIVIILDLPTTEYLELEDFIKNRIGNLLTTIGFQLQTISGTQAPGKTQ